MPVKRTNLQRNEKHDKNLPHLSPWLGSGFGRPLWKATWLPVQVVQGLEGCPRAPFSDPSSSQVDK